MPCVTALQLAQSSLAFLESSLEDLALAQLLLCSNVARPTNPPEEGARVIEAINGVW